MLFFQRVMAEKQPGNFYVDMRMMKEGAMNKEDFTEEAKVMQ